jgi:hypothetical protein
MKTLDDAWGRVCDDFLATTGVEPPPMYEMMFYGGVSALFTLLMNAAGKDPRVSVIQDIDKELANWISSHTPPPWSPDDQLVEATPQISNLIDGFRIRLEQIVGDQVKFGVVVFSDSDTVFGGSPITPEEMARVVQASVEVMSSVASGEASRELH